MLRISLLSLCMASCVMHGVELDISRAVLEAEVQKLAIPEERSYRVPTLNHYGYMFTKFDPVVERFLEAIDENPKQTFFEVGGAYGNVAEAALEKGIEQYYLNDCEERHLKAFAGKLKDTGKMHLCQALHLICGRCPEEVQIEEGSFDAILVNKVLHFLTPDTIDAFVRWVNLGLKTKGKIFVFTISPFYRGHKEFLEEYHKRKEAGDRFPGYFPKYHESTPAQKYGSLEHPANLLFMDLGTLKELFLQHGFQIEEEFELAVIDTNHPEWRPGTDMVGLIARKL